MYQNKKKLSLLDVYKLNRSNGFINHSFRSSLLKIFEFVNNINWENTPKFIENLSALINELYSKD